MRSFVLFTIVMALGLIVGAGGEDLPLLIKNVTIIDGLPSSHPVVASVLVEGDRISKIILGDLIPVSQANVIDGHGKFLIPGFIDTSVHISFRSNISGTFKGFDSRETDSLDRDILEKDAQKRLAKYKTILRYSLRSGTTTVVDSITSVADVSMLKQSLTGEDPNFYSLGPELGLKPEKLGPLDATINPQDPNEGWKLWLPELNEHISDADRQAALAILKGEITKLITEGDLAGLRVSADKVPLEILQVICSVAKANQKPVFFTATTNEGILNAVKAGANIKVGAPWVEGSQPASSATSPSGEVLQAMASNHVQILSLDAREGNLAAFLKNLYTFDEEAFLNPTIPKDTKNNYDKLIKQYADVHDADPERPLFFKNVDDHLTLGKLSHELLGQAHHQYGISILPTADSGMPWVFHGDLPLEMAQLNGRGAQGQNAVLTPQEIISSATYGAAQSMNLQTNLGSIESGKKADMILLNANPLDDISNVRKIDAVIKSGKLVNFQN